jgi:hypothetical protein
MRMLIGAFAAALFMSFAAPAWAATLEASLKELRQTFTLQGKPIPPEVFGDFGDSDLADSGSIRVTIDLLAAMGSNLYADEITKSPDGWVAQKKEIQDVAGKLTQAMRYKFNGVAQNGLLVVTAAFSGGGSGDFVTLHILDASASRGFDSEGKRTDRLNLTIIRSIPLGDRWNGSVKVAGDKIEIATAPGSGGDRRQGMQVIEAARPW